MGVLVRRTPGGQESARTVACRELPDWFWRRTREWLVGLRGPGTAAPLSKIIDVHLAAVDRHLGEDVNLGG
jgi:hypothetical protein